MLSGDTKASSIVSTGVRCASVESDTRSSGVGVGRASLTIAANSSPPGNRSSPGAEASGASLETSVVGPLPGAKPRKRRGRDGARRRQRCAEVASALARAVCLAVAAYFLFGQGGTPGAAGALLHK